MCPEPFEVSGFRWWRRPGVRYPPDPRFQTLKLISAISIGWQKPRRPCRVPDQGATASARQSRRHHRRFQGSATTPGFRPVPMRCFLISFMTRSYPDTQRFGGRSAVVMHGAFLGTISLGPEGADTLWPRFVFDLLQRVKPETPAAPTGCWIVISCRSEMGARAAFRLGARRRRYEDLVQDRRATLRHLSLSR